MMDGVDQVGAVCPGVCGDVRAAELVGGRERPSQLLQAWGVRVVARGHELPQQRRG